MAYNYETQETEPLKHYENLPNKFFEFDILNTKALKNWLIFENFHFFPLKFFWDMDNVETRKNAENLIIEVWREAGEIITLYSYFYKAI